MGISSTHRRTGTSLSKTVPRLSVARTAVQYSGSTRISYNSTTVKSGIPTSAVDYRQRTAIYQRYYARILVVFEYLSTAVPVVRIFCYNRAVLVRGIQNRVYTLSIYCTEYIHMNTQMKPSLKESETHVE